MIMSASLHFGIWQSNFLFKIEVDFKLFFTFFYLIQSAPKFNQVFCKKLKNDAIEILSNFCPKKPQQEEIGHKISVLFEFYEGAPGY